MIVFFGAEFTQQYALATGAKIVVAENARIIDQHAGLQLDSPGKADAKNKHNSASEMKNEKELFSELDKKHLHLVITKIQIKDKVSNFFSIRKKHKPA
jgi:hypothetical protein